MIGNIDWKRVFNDTVGSAENKYNVILGVDVDILAEVAFCVKKNLAAMDVDHPNVAKVAGLVSFWIRKLKPIYTAPESPNKEILINEVVSLYVGLSICKKYYDDTTRTDFKIKPRILRDWVHSFRYHSHSPSSSLIAFELLTTAK